MAPDAGGTVVAPGLLPGAHGGWKFCADDGVVVPDVPTAPGCVFVDGVLLGCVVVDGLFFAELPVDGALVGFAAVRSRGVVPGRGVVLLAAAVPVPVPAGTHGIVVGDCGVVDVVGLGLFGTGASVPGGVVGCVCGTGACVPVGVGCVLGVGLCASTAANERAAANAAAPVRVNALRFMEYPLSG